MGYALASSGDTTSARQIYAELVENRRQGHSYHLAMICAGLADRDGIHRWLNQALLDRDVGLTFMRVEPRWRPFDDDPVVQKVVTALGFPSS